MVLGCELCKWEYGGYVVTASGPKRGVFIRASSGVRESDSAV